MAWMWGIEELAKRMTEPPPQRVLLIGNPHARNGSEAQSLVAPLESQGLGVHFEMPDDIKSLHKLIAEIGKSVDRIVLCGGDGTISAALPALIEVGKPLVVIPFGTANDLARNLHLPMAREAQVALVGGGKPRRIDLGTVNGRPFLNAASIGLGAAVAALHQGRAKRWLGVLNYPRVLFLAWRRSRPFTVEIDCDGRAYRGTFLHLAVVNGRFHGGGLEPRPSASIADAELDLYALPDEPILQLVRHLAALRTTGSENPELFHLTGQRITVASDQARDVNVDGELSLQTPLTFGVLPRALSVVVPT